jgi:hypothetical protein
MEITTKFNVNDTAWLVFDNKPQKTTIKAIDVKVTSEGTTESYTHGYPPDTKLYTSIEEMTDEIKKQAEELPKDEEPKRNTKGGV